MGLPADYEFIEPVDYPRASGVLIEDEEHTLTAGTTDYFLAEVPDGELSITCTGDVQGEYVVDKTLSLNPGTPEAGHVWVCLLNGRCWHTALDADDDLTWGYTGLGTANTSALIGQYAIAINLNRQAAWSFKVTAVSPASQSVNIAGGDTCIGGKTVRYAGGALNLSAVSFVNPGYYKAVRVAMDAATSEPVYLEGPESATLVGCVDPAAIPNSKTIAIVYMQDGEDIESAAIVNIHDDVAGYTGDGGSSDGGGAGGVKMAYSGTVVSGDAVCMVGNNTVGRAAANDDAKVPAQYFVEAILDATYCTVKGSGAVMDFTGKTRTYGSLTFGLPVYLSTAAGYITQARNQTPDEWDQCLGVALSATKVAINIGTAMKNQAGPVPPPPDGPVPPPPTPPDGWKMYRGPGVSEGDFVYAYLLQSALLAKANADLTMPAIGIDASDVDTTWCIVQNNYTWIVADHGGLYPGGLTPGSAGDLWYISVSTAGEVDAPPMAANPEHYIQIAVRQIDEEGTKFLVCCGPAVRPQPGPGDDGYDTPCANDVAVGNSVYLDSSGIARKTDASNDAKVNAVGIVKAVNQANDRCTIVRPPNVYDPDGGYAGGEYVLDPSAAGTWGLLSSVLFRPGDWKVRIGWGRGATVKGLLVDIQNYGKFTDPGGDNGTDPDPVNRSRLVGWYKAAFQISAGTWVQDDPVVGYVTASDYAEPNQMRGVVLSGSVNCGAYWNTPVLMRGLYGSGYTAGQLYYNDDVSGGIGPVLALGKYIKRAGVGMQSGELYVDPQPTGWMDGNVNPCPVLTYVPGASGFDPMPVQMHEKIFNDGTTSGSKMTYPTGYTSPMVPADGQVVIASISARVESSGTDAAGYLTVDVFNNLGSSLLGTKGKIYAAAGAMRDLICGSKPGSSDVLCIMDKTKFPLTPGHGFYVSGMLSKDYLSANPYGLSIVVKYYYVKG